jgi:hypothetical protein
MKLNRTNQVLALTGGAFTGREYKRLKGKQDVHVEFIKPTSLLQI